MRPYIGDHYRDNYIFLSHIFLGKYRKLAAILFLELVWQSSTWLKWIHSHLIANHFLLGMEFLIEELGSFSIHKSGKLHVANGVSDCQGKVRYILLLVFLVLRSRSYILADFTYMTVHITDKLLDFLELLDRWYWRVFNFCKCFYECLIFQKNFQWLHFFFSTECTNGITTS